MRLAIAAIALVAAGCTTAAPRTAEITGTVAYRERMALPPGAVVAVRLEDQSRADAPAVTIAQTQVSPITQVPVPFTLSYDPSALKPGMSYGLRADIRAPDGELMFVTDTHNAVDPAAIAASYPLMLVRTGGEAAAPSDPWGAAKARGIKIRAVGNEPGWHAEIGNGMIVAVTDYGEKRASVPLLPATQLADGSARYYAQTEATTLELILREGECSDTMSDTRYPIAAQLTLNGKVYKGCARTL